MKQPHNYSIQLENLTMGYPGRTLFTDVNVDFKPGELTALIGRNGTGKSTLLRTIMGLLRPLHGTVRIGGERLHELSVSEVAKLISFVSTDVVRAGNLSVYDVVGLGRAPYTNWMGNLTSEDRQMVEESLELVGMSDFSAKSLETLSDGERQRVMIARSLAQDTPVILLDEPTAFLDLPNKYEIGLLLRKLSREREKTILFSTHDLNIAIELCDKLVMIEAEHFLCGSPQTMIENGSLDLLFSGTSIAFDRHSGTIRLTDWQK